MPNREFMLLKTIKYLKNSESTNEYSSKGVKASDLSKFLSVTKPAISKLINTLEEKMGEEDTDEMIRLFKKMYDTIIEMECEYK